MSLSLDGVDIIANPSGSHHQLRKADRRVNLIQNAMKKCGGIYLFSNHRGGDGDRLYFDGCASICVNGQFLAQGEQFSLKDIQVLTVCIDVEQVSIYRNRIRSFQVQGEKSARYPRVKVNFSLLVDDPFMVRSTKPIEWQYHTAMEEIA